MATLSGAHSDRVAAARELLDAKGRRAQGRFAFEGPTLLEEAIRSNIHLDEIFATSAVYERNAHLRNLEQRGTPIHLVDERTARKISDLETPPGLVCIAPLSYAKLDALLADPLTLVLADLNDPGNVGTLLRSAEAFGVGGVVFGNLGVDPYHPKVVRGAMGAIFRLKLAIAEPHEFAFAAKASGAEVIGLDAGGQPLRGAPYSPRTALVVGHERRGLGPWSDVVSRRVALRMTGPTESLNAAVAGSIALYELQNAEIGS